MKTIFTNSPAKDKIFIIAILSFAAVIFYILNVFTPLIGDDFAYLYKFGPKALLRPTNVLVNNIFDVFESQYYHYLDVNGRFFSHFLLQLFLLFGKFYFNIFNTILFIGLILIISNYKKNSLVASKQKYLIIFVLFSLWFCATFMGQTMLAVTGATNYFWGSFFVVLFLFIYRREEENQNAVSLVKLISLFIFSFCISSSNESVSFGVAAALFFTFISSFRKLKPIFWVMIIGFGLGVLAIIFSPATSVRAHNEIVPFTTTGAFLHTKLLEIVAILYFLRFSLAITFLLLICLKLKKENIYNLFLKEKLIILSIIFNCIFLLIVGNPAERMLFGSAILMILFNATLFVECLKSLPKFSLNIAGFVLMIILSFSFYNAFSEVGDYRKNNIILENQFKNKQEKVFYIHAFSDSRFVFDTVSGIFDAKNYHNRVRAFHYGLQEINLIPEDLYQKIFKEKILESKNVLNQHWKNELFYLKKQKLIIVKLPDNFQYLDFLSVKFDFKSLPQQKIPASVIPLKGIYYAFIPSENIDFNAISSFSVADQSGKLIEKIDKLK